MAERPYFQIVGDHMLEKGMLKGDSFTTHDICEETRTKHPNLYARRSDNRRVSENVIRALHTMECIYHSGYGQWEIAELPNANTEKNWRNAIGEEQKAQVTPCGSCEHVEATIIGSAYAYACPILKYFMQK